MSVESGSRVRRRLLSGPVFGLTLGMLVAGAAQAAAPVLPTGGRVAAGSAVIGAPGAGALTVTQSSSKAILDWTGFSIAKGGKVVFDNGSGATLNRVTGTSVSSINGLLSATGSVYLINPNGVIVGRSGVVDVGGTFVASTLDTSDASFLSGGALSFSGTSNAAVLNYGRIGALGGDVALVAARVSNAGSLSAAQGAAGLIAGHDVVMLRDGSLDQGRFSVLLGGAATRVTDTGLIAAADAELRAEGGNVYALAGDTTGVIRATGVESGGGKVWLVAPGGELDLRGAVTAQGPGGAAGAIETSGGTVKLGDARIDAHGGTWLVDPYNLTINAPAAKTIDKALNAGTSVTEQTTANGYSGSGVASASGKGDITVAAPITWSTNAGLTLSAYRNIDVNASITSSGGGSINLDADNTGTGVGTVSFGSGALASTSGAVNILYNPAGNDPLTVNSTSYTTPASYIADVAGGAQLTAYMLVNTVYDLQNIENNLSGAYALGRDIDAGITNASLIFKPIGTVTFDQSDLPDQTAAFQGMLDGQSHSIQNLTINMPEAAGVGLFGGIGSQGIVRNATFLGGTIVGADYVGTLVGVNLGNITDVNAATKVTASDYAGQGTDGEFAGGLVGLNEGLIDHSDASGSVSGYTEVGGLAGGNNGKSGVATIQNSHASGAVTELGGAEAGGLVGASYGAGSTMPLLINDYATGAVVGTGIDGGLAGEVGSGAVTRSYATGAVSVSGDSAGQPFNGEAVGGLIGYVNRGHDVSITEDYASGTVSGLSSVGGLIGEIAAPRSQVSYLGTVSVSDVYAIGSISVGDGPEGGLIGSIDSTVSSNVGPTNSNTIIRDVYAAITSPGSVPGGLVGSDDGPVSIARGYFDTTTSGTNNDTAGGIGLTTAQFRDATSPISGLGLGTTPGGAAFVIIDSDGTLNGSNGATRPILLSEYSTTITNAHQLQLMALNLSATYTLAANIDASGTSNPSDVWGPAGFVPVGQASAPFTGVLNGAGHTVASLKIDSAGATDVGLIGDLGAGGVAESLILSGNVVGGTDVGALVGYNAGTVSGASGKGTVSGSTAVGGLVGYNAGMISGSSGKAAVSSPAGAGSELGGLAGLNTGQLTADEATDAVSGNTEVGGLVGYNQGGAIDGAYATGAVSGTSGKTAAGSGSQIGGLVGRNDGVGVVSDSHATGAVSGYDEVGGLVGYNTETSGGFDVSGSYATGAVTGVSGAGTPAASGAQVGGLIGENASPIISDYATGAVSGARQVGGLVGENTSNGQILSTYATGAVSASAGQDAEGGGLVGYNANEVTDSYATGKVTGGAGSGGFIGLNDSRGIVNNSYAIGASGVGFAGVNDGTLLGDLFDEGTTGTSVGVGAGSASGLTAIGGSTGLDPYQASTYQGFNFSTVWTIDPGTSRPYLISQPQTPPPS